MKIWLDDLRPMPNTFDIHIKTAQKCINILKTQKVTHISFDHDLGLEECGTGYDVAKYIEEAAYFGMLTPVQWFVHSANPQGKRNITAAMMNAEKYWKQQNEVN